MPEYGRTAARLMAALALAASLILSGMPAAFAGPGDVNSVNDGPNVGAGTYYNTPDGKTTFTNSAGTGLYLQAGDTVIGRQVDPNTLLENGNGGHIHFDVPGQVVRLDGNIDVGPLVKTGNGGTFSVNAGMYEQNGAIFAPGGLVQLNVTGMTQLGPTARIDASNINGVGGVVRFNQDIPNGGAIVINKGAVIDTSGEVIGLYNTNVIQMKGSIVNLDGVLMANGLKDGQQGGKIDISATDSVKIGPSGQLMANGADGVIGVNPTSGGNGGTVIVSAERNIDNNGLIAANGGKGGTNPDIASGAVVDDYTEKGQVFIDQHGNRVYKTEQNGQTVYVNDADEVVYTSDVGLTANKVQFTKGEDGGNGGNGGFVDVHFKGQMTNAGKIEVVGGNGGDGQQAVSDTMVDGPHNHIAYGGNGGSGGTGGRVRFFGNPTQDVLNNVNVSGGSGGSGGAAATLNDCGCAEAGAGGACGAPGSIEVHPYTPPTPPTPPGTPLYPPYPREYPRLGDTLPNNTPQVLNYNRSIFLARAPLPIIQKKTPPPPPPAPVKPPVVPKPKPKPPQKKVPVRGYW